RTRHIFPPVAGSGSELCQAHKALPCPTSARPVPFAPVAQYVPAYWAWISFPVVEEPRCALAPSSARQRGDRTICAYFLPDNDCAWRAPPPELWAPCAGGNRITRRCRFRDRQDRLPRSPGDTRPPD